MMLKQQPPPSFHTTSLNCTFPKPLPVSIIRLSHRTLLIFSFINGQLMINHECQSCSVTSVILGFVMWDPGDWKQMMMLYFLHRLPPLELDVNF